LEYISERTEDKWWYDCDTVC